MTHAAAGPAGTSPSARDGGRLAAPTRRTGRSSGSGTSPSGRRVVTLRGSGGPVTAVAFGPDGKSLATAAAGAANGRPFVTHWDLASSRAIRTFEAGLDRVEALAYSGDGRRLAAGGGAEGRQGWVVAWDTETGAVLGRLTTSAMSSSSRSTRRGPDRGRGLRPDKVHLWDLATGTFDHETGAKRRQLRRVHAGRQAAGGAGVRR